MRFGMQLPTYGPIADPGVIARAAGRADELGYDSVWVNDHVLVPSRISRYGRIFEALTTLAWVAGHTARARIGTSVLILPQREAILAAKQLATIDVLSGGRLIVGLAVGYVAEEYHYLRAPFERRGALIEEQLAAMRALWSGTGSFHGDSIAFEDASFGPTPLSGERLPIWLGGHSPPALRRAARLADAWHAAHLDVPTMARKRAELLALAGGRRVETTLKLRLFLTRRPGEHRARVQDELPGDTELVGTPARVRERIAEYDRSGLDELVVAFPHEEVGALHWAMETFAAEVAAPFR
jgi:probable F420-dependent oxidoreductase